MEDQWKLNKKQLPLYLVMLLLHGLNINTYYSIIIVIGCTLMINKDTQTQRSSTYFFLLTLYKALKVLFQQRRTWTSIFFFHCLDSKKRTFRARHAKIINNNFFNVFNQDAGFFFLAIWFIPQIPKPTSDWEWHKTSRSRVHPVKIHLIILHVPTFWWVCPRNAWGQDHWIYRDKWCVLKVRQDIWSLSYFKIHDVILVNFRSDATSKTVPKYIPQPYGRAGSDRRKEELPSLSQFV